jgi:hypothetical protein
LGWLRAVGPGVIALGSIGSGEFLLGPAALFYLVVQRLRRRRRRDSRIVLICPVEHRLSNIAVAVA